MTDDVPAICFPEDVAKAWRTSRRTIDRLIRSRTMPIPELPSIDKRRRFSGEDVKRYRDGMSSRLRRAG